MCLRVARPDIWEEEENEKELDLGYEKIRKQGVVERRSHLQAIQVAQGEN